MSTIKRDDIDNRDDEQYTHPLHHAQPHGAPVEQRLFRIARRTPHHIPFFGLRLEDNGAGRVNNQFEKGNVHGEKYQRPSQQHGKQRETGDWNVDGKDISQSLLEIIEDPSAQFYSLHDRREIVVKQYQRRGLARHIRAPGSHGYTDVGRLQGGRVVHAIARHGHDFTVGLQCIHQAQLLFRHDPSENIYRLNTPLQFRIVHPVQFGPRDILVRRGEAYLSSNVLRRDRIIPGYHHHPYARAVTLLDGACDGRPHRIGKPHKSQELEVEIVLVAGQTGLSKSRPRHAQYP